MTPEEYDEATCITAGELRAMGVPVAEGIPDVGWVPRSAILVDLGRSKLEPDGVTLTMELGVTFRVPFRWISVDVKVELPPAKPNA